MNTSRKKHIFMYTLICFIVGILLIPFIIGGLYIIGEKYPIIVLPFSPGEMLTYWATAFSLIISLIALFVALSANDPKIKIRRIASQIPDGSIVTGIEIINENEYPLLVSGVGLISPKKLKSGVKLM